MKKFLLVFVSFVVGVLTCYWLVMNEPDFVEQVWSVGYEHYLALKGWLYSSWQGFIQLCS